MEKTHSGAIKIGEVLHKRYKIIGYLGSGGFGITYKAIDSATKTSVAIKEYFPSNLVHRDVGTKNLIINSPSEQETFNWGLNSFIKEARILANLYHKNIIPIDDFFEENETAYFVMPYIPAIDLKDYMEKIDTFEEEDIYNIIIPLLEGLKEAHDNDILHRDIKPENILICKNKEPLLIDFGAAKDTIGKRTNTSKVIVSPPFAPFEQYGTDQPNGKYTDIYAIGMVMYVLMTQKKRSQIPTSVDRQLNKKLRKLEFDKKILKRYSKKLLKATKKATEIDFKKRVQNIDELMKLMLDFSDTKWKLTLISTIISSFITFYILYFLKI
jgi:serine/threonine protein kinase